MKNSEFRRYAGLKLHELAPILEDLKREGKIGIKWQDNIYSIMDLLAKREDEVEPPGQRSHYWRDLFDLEISERI